MKADDEYLLIIMGKLTVIVSIYGTGLSQGGQTVAQWYKALSIHRFQSVNYWDFSLKHMLDAVIISNKIVLSYLII